MKVELNLENDKKFRKHVKNLIKGQVLSVVREDYNCTIEEEISRRMNNISDFQFNATIKQTVEVILNNFIRNDSFIEEYIKQQIFIVIRDMKVDVMLERILKDKLKEALANGN